MCVCGPVVTYTFIMGDAIVVTLVYAKSRGKKVVYVTLCEALKSMREIGVVRRFVVGFLL